MISISNLGREVEKSNPCERMNGLCYTMSFMLIILLQKLFDKGIALESTIYHGNKEITIIQHAVGEL